MKKLALLLIPLIAIGIYAFTGPADNFPVLEIGAPAPLADNKMKDISGKEYSISELNGKNGMLVIFSCNTCPFVIGTNDSEGWEGRYNEIAESAEANNIGIVLINSNEAKREKGDSYDDMVSRAKDKNYKMPYVYDKNHMVADAFGARTTPHVFLFDKDLKLVYKGAIDDNNSSAARVKERWLDDALTNLANGKSIEPNSTKNIGVVALNESSRNT